MVSRTTALPLDLAPQKPWRRFVPSWLRSLIWVDSAHDYDAFLSYSWKSDGKVAPVIQSVLQRFLCPWYKSRAKTVFRDLSCLPAGSSLETELFDRLDRSNHFIVLASTEAAASHGMEIEARHWFSRPRKGEVLILISSGDCKSWDEIRERLLPPAVRNNLPTEPLWVPLQHRRNEILAASKNHHLRGELVEDLKQILLRLHPGRDWGQLMGEERSQRRKAIGLLVGLSAILLTLAIMAAMARIQAIHARNAATSRALGNASLMHHYTDKRFDLQSLLAVEAGRISDTFEARNAMLSILQSKASFVTYLYQDSEIKTVKFSPDGRLLVFAGDTGKIEFWDMVNHQRTALPQEDSSEPVADVAFSPDGKLFASVGDYRTIRLFDAITGRFKTQFSATEAGEASTSIIFVSGNIFVRNGYQVQGLEVASGKPVGASVRGWNASFSPAAGRLAVLEKGLIQLWDLRSQRPVGSPVQLEELDKSQSGDMLVNVFSSPDGTLLAIQGSKGAVVWDLPSGRRVGQPFQGSCGERLTISPDNQFMADTCGGTILIWEIKRDQETPSSIQTAQFPINKFEPSGAPVNSIAFSPDSKLLASGSNDGAVVVWRVVSETQEGSLWRIGDYIQGAEHDYVHSIAFSPDSKLLAAGTTDGTIQLWDTISRKSLKVALNAHDSAITTLAFSPDGKTLASASKYGGIVQLWQIPELKREREPFPGYSASFSPDGTMLAVGGEHGKIELWSMAQHQRVGAALEGHTELVNAMAFSRNGKLLASASDDKSVRLWNVKTRQALFPPLFGHIHSVVAIAFSRDEKLLVSAGEDDSLRLWDVTAGRLFGDRVHFYEAAEVRSVAFSADGKILASGNEDMKLRFMDAATGQPMGTSFKIYSNGESVAFSPDGKLLAAASDGGIWLVPMTLPIWAEKICSMVSRNLSHDEWAQYIGANVPYHRTCPDLPDGKRATIEMQP